LYYKHINSHTRNTSFFAMLFFLNLDETKTAVLG